ncbi:hypothetical protein [Caulobacter sp.]|uniref:hypothetical protein n=1 Tax=Caulobacter sp. TaxID=78 RepID=UPI001B052CCD|nr:hypothetical protein [Caulobacter sp.]MBO9544482.1 hypothetical protein [Caulobacter sp.]
MAGLVDLIVLMALLLVLPGFVLILAPNVLLYAAPIRLAIWLWRDRRSVPGAVLALGVAVAVGWGPPAVVNQRLEKEALELRAEDFDHVTPDMAKPRTVRLDWEREASGCGSICRALLARGLVERVASPLENAEDLAAATHEGIYRFADARACQAAGVASEASAMGCILRTVEERPKIDALIRITSLREVEREVDTWKDRLDPLGAGNQSVERLELWPCAEVDGCLPLVRRTYVSQERLFSPLLLYVDRNDYGLELHRAWTRVLHGGRADAVAFLASKWPSAARRLDETQLQTLVIALDEGAPTVPDPDLDPEGTRLMLRAIEDGAGPLSKRETALLRKMFDGQHERLPGGDISRRPEAVETVKDLLGNVLLAQKGRDSSVLWMAQTMIADLPEADYARMRPVLKVWLAAPGSLAAGRNNERFLIRLSDLGPVIVAPLVTEMTYHDGLVPDGLTIGETTAAMAALCLVGDPDAAPTLRRRKLQIKDPRFKASELRALNTTLDHIEGRTAKGACLKLFPDVPGRGEAWAKQFADARGIAPAP